MPKSKLKLEHACLVLVCSSFDTIARTPSLSLSRIHTLSIVLQISGVSDIPTPPLSSVSLSPSHVSSPKVNAVAHNPHPLPDEVTSTKVFLP